MKTLWFSLRRRLIFLLLGGVAVAWAATLVFSFIDAHHEIDELLDAQLVQAAQTLLALADRGEVHEENGIEDLGDISHKYQSSLRFQIWNADGKLLLRSKNTPVSPLTIKAGFSETTEEGIHWRQFSQWNTDHSLQVQVSENHFVRDRLIRQVEWRMLSPALFGLPLIGFWVWWGTRRGLSPLNEIAGQIASRDPQQLQALEPQTAPLEIKTMIEALNGLFQRVEAALEAERRFTADAAHELRTPFAALQAQLQVALRARDEEERARSLKQMQSGLLRASRLVEQMLQLARLDPESGLLVSEAVDLRQIAEAVCAELGPLILSKNLDFDLSYVQNCQVLGQADWLRILVRNLVDNAVRYTPEEGKVDVVIACDGECCMLKVTDSGPGIPDEEGGNVFQRFRRLDGEESGSGLGLPIVARIAELHRAKLTLSKGYGEAGLEVCVALQRVKA